MKRLPYIVLMLMLLHSCKGEYGDYASYEAPSLGGVEASVGSSSVRLTCNLASSRAGECGFYFGVDSLKMKKYSSSLASDLSFSSLIEGLEASTRYYYRAFAGNGRYEEVSDIQELSTLGNGDVTAALIIPDAAFREYLLATFDKDGNGVLSASECAAVQSIRLETDKVESLEGIASFPNLTELVCTGDDYSNGGSLASVDLSGNPALRYLDVSYNCLTELDLSANTALEELYCQGNSIVSLNLLQNNALSILRCSPMSSLKEIYLIKGHSYDKTLPSETTVYYR